MKLHHLDVAQHRAGPKGQRQTLAAATALAPALEHRVQRLDRLRRHRTQPGDTVKDIGLHGIGQQFRSHCVHGGDYLYPQWNRIHADGGVCLKSALECGGRRNRH